MAARRIFVRREFWLDVKAMDRLRYKNHNQHRTSLHFRRWQETRKTLQRLNELNIPGLLTDIIDCMHPQRNKRGLGPLEFVPSQNFLIYSTIRTASLHRLLFKLEESLKDAYIAFRALVKQTYFMPLSMLVMAALSRLFIFVQEQQNAAEGLYSLLRSWSLVAKVDSTIPLLIKPESLPMALTREPIHEEEEVVHVPIIDTGIVSNPEFVSLDNSLPSEPHIQAEVSDNFWSSLSAEEVSRKKPQEDIAIPPLKSVNKKKMRIKVRGSAAPPGTSAAGNEIDNIFGALG
ncbi:hypothetical protein DFS34DRAFT_651218 [Phlyctochytrium arcticum]|nr:hypothetical protein DFS34DRAFT_651218 [Phlyctochytrium arcticum]